MRIARRTVPGMVHHVISRIIDREWLIDDEARECYLQLLGRAFRDSDWRCLSWALMSNHMHHGVVAGESTLASWVQRVHAPFASWLNERHGWIGPVFAGRPTVWIVRPEREGELIAYIHNNPVRAGLGPARDSTWTSHRAYVGLARAPAWLALREGMRRAGCRTNEEFEAFVSGRASVTRNEPELSEFYKEARRRGAVELATPTLDPVEVPIVARYYAHVRPDPREIISAIAVIAGISYQQVCGTGRQAPIASVRRVIFHAAALFGISRAATATALGISPQAGSKHALASLSAGEEALLSEYLRRLDSRPEASCESGQRP
jgi:hypothetical protein